MLNVSRSAFGIDRLNVFADGGIDQGDNLVDCDGLAACDICNCAAGRYACWGSLQASIWLFGCLVLLSFGPEFQLCGP